MGKIKSPVLTEKKLFYETFKKPYCRFEPDKLPILPAMKEGAVVVDAYLLGDGNVDRDGTKLQYLDIRVYVGEKL